MEVPLNKVIEFMQTAAKTPYKPLSLNAKIAVRAKVLMLGLVCLLLA